MTKLLGAAAALVMMVGATAADAQTAYRVLRIDPNNLYDVVWAYRELYAKSAVPDIAWTGSASTCAGGSVPVWTTLKTLQAINFWRVMAGLEGEETYLPSALHQQGAMLVSANGGLAYDTNGQSTTTTSYTNTPCRSAVSSGILTGTGMGVGASNAAAVTAMVAENGSQPSNVQLRNRNEVFRGSTSTHAVGLAGGPGNVAVVTGVGTAVGNIATAPVQYTFPRSGHFPAVAGMLPQRFMAVGYARDASTFAFSATQDGQLVAGTLKNSSDQLNLDNRYFVGGKLPASPSVSGTQTSGLSATFSGIRNGSPTGSAAGPLSINLTLFDPAGYDNELVESGWYWDATTPDGGNGVAIDQTGDRIYLAAYTYRPDGSPVWYSGMCNVSSKSCSGMLKEYGGGKNLVGEGNQAGEIGNAGAFSLTWVNKAQATLTYPGGTMNLSRFKPKGGTDADAVPMTGWYWDRNSTGGEGWFFEVSGGYMFLANYSYSGGQATWFTASGDMSSDKLRLENAPIMRCTGGRTINQPPGSGQIRDGACQAVGNITVAFTGTDRAAAQIVVGGTAKTVNLNRYWLNTASAQ